LVVGSFFLPFLHLLPWALAALLANHVLIATQALWPTSRTLGPNLVRLAPARCTRGEVALTFDDGPDPEVTPRVLDLLDEFGARATFFVLGSRVERYPEVAREIVRRGHRLENHSHHHPHTFSFFPPGPLGREIDRAQAAITAVAGRTPLYFRAPAGIRSPWLEPVLARRGLHLAAWTRRGFDTADGNTGRVLRRLLHRLAPGDILLLHDHGAARTADGEPVVLTVLPRLLAAMARRGFRGVALAAGEVADEGGEAPGDEDRPQHPEEAHDPGDADPQGRPLDPPDPR